MSPRLWLKGDTRTMGAGRKVLEERQKLEGQDRHYTGKCHTNDANGVYGHVSSFANERVSIVPESISVADDPTELCRLLENEESTKNTWVTVAIASAKPKRLDVGIEFLSRPALWQRGRAKDWLSIINGLCWLSPTSSVAPHHRHVCRYSQ
ncbi:hypothetical protein CC80DRAFT_556276 [Byssothecium circinans]|uniref:Uncharacterized protein n=1 Tax=Byssothecium circinans TaxID=147558 RepID=A0A6A5T7F8_9PLEO|nr:hypothetical protein CC80DRAFT_556276 [Byssothecium circinans]